MIQRSDRETSARGGERRVGLFIDFEGLRRSGSGGEAEGEVAELAERLRDLAQEHGRLLVAQAYADWSGARPAARELQRHGIEPRLALARDGEDAALLTLCLDAQETLYLGPDLDAFVIVAGDNVCQELVLRLRRADRAVVVVALEASALAPGARGGERFVPLDDLLGLKPRPRAAAARPGPARRAEGAPDWAAFVHLMEELERGMPFVGFGWLLKKKLSPENSGCYTMQEKQELMDRAVEDGVLTLYKVENIEEGGDPVTACKLNREHPRVRELTGP